MENIDNKFMNHGRQLNAKQQSPFTTEYIPEMDTYPELYVRQINYSEEFIGCLRLAIESGPADIATEVALL